MFFMYYAMAIGTQNNQIINGIILSIFIYMMNSKDFCNFIISTFLTFFYSSSHLQSFPYTRVRRIPVFMIRFSSAFGRTIFSKSHPFSIYKTLSTMQTIESRKRFPFRFVITTPATVFPRSCP